MTLVTVRIADAGGHDEIAWAEGQTVTLSRSLMDRIGWTARLTINGDLAVPQGPSGINAADAVESRERAAFTKSPPASARLPFSYQLVPAPSAPRWRLSSAGASVPASRSGRSSPAGRST